MKYSSTRRIESRAYPGVFYTLKKMSDQRRSELMRSIAPLKPQIREIQNAFGEINDRRLPVNNPDGTPKMNEKTGEQETKFASAADELQAGFLVEDLDEYTKTKVHPAYVRWGLLSIEGLEIDDAPATIDSLLELGPSDLVEEILAEIEGRTDLPAEQQKKLPSPIISSEPEPATTPVTAADPAEQPETSREETVLATTLAS